MTPVINPWVFYVMNVVDELDMLTFVGSLLSMIIIVAFGIMAFIEFDWEKEFTDTCKRWIKMAKRSAVVLAIFTAFTIFIPSSDTITKMIVAQNVTYERVEVATNTVQEVYEDIMGLFKEEEK